MTVKREQVEFRYGDTVARDAMRSNTIYLDGVVRGPVIDSRRNAYSFDHHGDCVRMATLATCQQVRTALELGLDPAGMVVVLNDLDADASLSLWLLRHPERATEAEIAELVEQVGFIDAHGPVRTVPELMDALEHPSRETQTVEMLWDDQALIDAWYEEGESALPEPDDAPKIDGFGVTPEGRVEHVDAVIGISEVYAQGYVAGVLCPPGTEGSTGYFVAKRSDFVPFEVGEFLEAMNEREEGWGGGSTVGGAPRRADGRRSELSAEVVREVLEEVASKM